MKSGSAFRCRDCGGSIEACPSCGGWLDMKMGKFGRFLGCSNFPDCDYTRNLQRPTPVGRAAEKRDKARPKQALIGHDEDRCGCPDATAAEPFGGCRVRRRDMLLNSEI